MLIPGQVPIPAARSRNWAYLLKCQSNFNGPKGHAYLRGFIGWVWSSCCKRKSPMHYQKTHCPQRLCKEPRIAPTPTRLALLHLAFISHLNPHSWVPFDMCLENVRRLSRWMRPVIASFIWTERAHMKLGTLRPLRLELFSNSSDIVKNSMY